MDWCGCVGEVSELFRTEWIVGYHWAVPKISSMPPRREGLVHYSPSFRFMDSTWYLGIYQSPMVKGEEWIGLEVCRRPQHPVQHVRFSVGLMNVDKLEYLVHRNKNYPPNYNFCCMDKFLPMHFLKERRDKLVPSDVLTITCVIWPDVPSPEEIRRFWHSELQMNSGSEESPNRIDIKEDSCEETRHVPATEFENGSVDVKKEIRDSTGFRVPASMPHTPDGILREVSRGVEWEVCLPAPTIYWDLVSPKFTCGELKYYFNLYPGKSSHDICLCFIVNVSNDADFPLPIRWLMAVKTSNSSRLRWIMSGQSVETNPRQLVLKVDIKRDELESSSSSGTQRLIFVNHLSVGEVDMQTEASTQTVQLIDTKQQSSEKTQVSYEAQSEDVPASEEKKSQRIIEKKENTQVSCGETQTEGVLTLEAKESQSTVQLKESEEDHIVYLQVPREEECICHIKQSFERRLHKLLAENSDT